MDTSTGSIMETSLDADDDPFNLQKLHADIKKYLKEYNFMYLFPSSDKSFKAVAWASEKHGADFGSFVWARREHIRGAFEGLEWSEANKKAMKVIHFGCFKNTCSQNRGLFFTNKEKHQVLSFFASVHVQFSAKVGRTAIENIVVPAKTVVVKRDLQGGVWDELQQSGIMRQSGKIVELARDLAVCRIGDILSKNKVSILKSFGHAKINQFKVGVSLVCSIREGKCEQLDDKILLQTLKDGASPLDTGTEEALDTQEGTFSLETPIELRDRTDELKALVEQYESVFLFSMENRRDSLVEFVQRNMKHHKILIWKNKLLQNVLGRTPELEIFKNIHKLADKVVGDQGLLLTNKSKKEVQRFFGAFDLPIYEKFSRIPSQTIQLEPGSLNEYPLLKACPFHFIRNKLPIHIEGDNWWLMRPVLLCQRGVHLSDFDFKIMELFRNEIGKFKMRMDYMWTPDGTFVDLQAEKEAENTGLNWTRSDYSIPAMTLDFSSVDECIALCKAKLETAAAEAKKNPPAPASPPPLESNVPWWTEECATVTREKKRAYRRFARTQLPERKVEFGRARAKARHTIEEARRNYMMTLDAADVSSASAPLSSVWKKGDSDEAEDSMCGEFEDNPPNPTKTRKIKTPEVKSATSQNAGETNGLLSERKKEESTEGNKMDQDEETKLPKFDHGNKSDFLSDAPEKMLGPMWP